MQQQYLQSRPLLAALDLVKNPRLVWLGKGRRRRKSLSPLKLRAQSIKTLMDHRES